MDIFNILNLEEHVEEKEHKKETPKKKTNGNDGQYFKVKQYLDEVTNILFTLQTISNQNYSEFKLELESCLYRLEQIHRKLNNLTIGKLNKEPNFKTISEMFLEMRKPINQHRFFKVLKDDPMLSDTLHLPLYKNNAINSELLMYTKNRESFMELVIKECRAYEDYLKAWEVYYIIRASLNSATITDRDMSKIINKIEFTRKGSILSNSAQTMFIYGNKELVPFYKLYTGNTESEVMVCSLCNSIATKNSLGAYVCRGESFCSQYRDSKKPSFIELKHDGLPIWEINDIYYEFVTLPNIYEQITLNEIQLGLGDDKDRYEYNLYPGIDRDGDILIKSKDTPLIFLIDCKKYKRIVNLVEYEIKDISTIIKVKKLPKDTKFMFVIPDKLIKKEVVQHVRSNSEFNRNGITILTEKEVAGYIKKETQKYLKKAGE